MSPFRSPVALAKVLHFATMGLAVWGIMACLVCFLIWSNFPLASVFLWRGSQVAVLLALAVYLLGTNSARRS